MRHPVGVALASSAFLLAAAAPLIWTTLTGPNSDFVPHNKPAYEANSYVEAHYPRDVTEAVTVAVDGPRRPGQLAAFDKRVLAVDGVVRGTPFLPAASDVAYANFALAEPATSSGAQDAVKEIRDLAGPATATVLVSGNTAGFIDQKQSIADHLPLLVDDHRVDDAADPLPAHRLRAAAVQDPADERDDARRHPRDRRPRLPGRPARRPLRLHRARAPSR